MAKAIVLRETGGPEVLRLEDVDVGAPAPGEVRLRQTAIGVNFHDCYVRSGLYQTLSLPGIPGLEAAGVIEAVGQDVEAFRPGDRVAYITNRYGGYASDRLISSRDLVRVPNDVKDDLAAAVLVKGLTAHMLLHRVHAVGPDDTILVHAAAGGVGQLLCQWARNIGATVIGTVGDTAKVELAKQAGCDEVILYRDEDFVQRVKQITKGRGVDVAYDSVGCDTFSGSLDCLANLGHLVNFGQSSGPIEPFQISNLSRGSYSVTRPMLFHYTDNRDSLDAMAAALFAGLTDGVLKVATPMIYPLANVATAHQALEARETTGSVVLTV
ncbi:MAG: quinone oxidoreductase [Alphaproteobacteria bacterium]|nr:quinone oxidoreductase [Alphaproteobacteria bacterium]